MTTASNTDGLAHLLHSLQKKEPGTANLEDIRAVIEAIMETVRSELTSTDGELLSELKDLANFIEGTKREIAALRPDEVKDEYLPTATDELDEVVSATADATHNIMDAAESIESVMDKVDPEIASTLMSATTQIYEACGFQDITGQRITKVVTALKDIENKIDSLIEAFGEEIAAIKSRHPDGKPVERKNGEQVSDEDLLHGPELGGPSNSQDDIDQLFS